MPASQTKSKIEGTKSMKVHEFDVDGTRIGENEPCYLIAEIGHNHMGNMVLAKRLIKAAKESGASAAKFQKRNIAALTTDKFGKTPVRDQPWSFGDTYLEQREALELSKSQYTELQSYAAEVGITFFATAFDPESADFLADLDMPAYKMASGDVTNTPLLEYVAKLGKPMFVSTGGSTLEDVKRAVDAIGQHNNDFAILQCSSTYPAPAGELNLNVIETYRRELPDRIVGLSHHNPGVVVSFAAYALGARVIEQHFTLDRNWRGTDQAFSIEPEDLVALRAGTDELRVAVGDGIKKIRESEKAGIEKNAKSIYAARDLSAGELLREEDVVFRSPGGISAPWMLQQLVGQKLKARVRREEPIRPAHFDM